MKLTKILQFPFGIVEFITSTASVIDWTEHATKKEQARAAHGGKKLDPDTVTVLVEYANTGTIGANEITGSGMMFKYEDMRAEHCIISTEQFDADVFALRARIINEGVTTRQKSPGDPHTDAVQLHNGLKLSPLTEIVLPA